MNEIDVNYMLRTIHDVYISAKKWYRKILATEEGYDEFIKFLANQLSNSLSGFGLKVIRTIYGDHHDLILYAEGPMHEYKIKIDTENDLIKVQ